MATTVLSLSPPSSSAAGFISYLEEDGDALKVRALQKLYQVVDLHWAEVCNSLPLIEALSEDETFPAADLAAALASKCFYHLQIYDDALRLALSAGKYLDLHENSEYVEVLLSKCIDEYKALRQKKDAAIDPRMEAIIDKMFQRCYRDGCYEQATGIALDTLRIDKLEEVCLTAIAAGRGESILGYAFGLCQGARNVSSREFRLEVIAVLVRLYSSGLAAPDHFNMCFGLQFLNRAADVAQILEKLLRGSAEHALEAYQIAFDLQESENQGFVLAVVEGLAALQAPAAEGAAAAADAATGDGEAMSVAQGGGEGESYESKAAKLRRILVESFDVDLSLSFLFKQSRSDLQILKDIKSATEGRVNSTLHNSTVIAHSYMNAGTTQDTFLRENLEWLGKATCWAKFTAVASIGVVHKGHVHESMNLLQPYLPRGGQSASPYSEAGALYALGLIHANKGGAGDSAAIRFLSDSLRNAGNNEIIQHGSCLGVGLATMATANETVFDMLHPVLITDNATAGEGAALAIGLLLLGQAGGPFYNERIEELVTYAHSTNHEKISRALALAMAMALYGKEESAEQEIEALVRDRDPIFRYGGMYAIALAYCGTGDNTAIQRLLHVAVSDVNDDVRRAAVSCIGIVMFRSPDVVPSLVSLLAESFNPHVRYGACMAVGIACAGSALTAATDLLAPLLQDASDFVRQGALMGMALVLQQTSEARSSVVKKFRDTLKAVMADKHQPVIAKSGAILAAGILDAGGRNVVASLQSRGGFTKMGAAVGVVMFLQAWYWYPLYHFLSLAFSPTMLIGLNEDFDMPTAFEVICNSAPSVFAYPKPEEKKEGAAKAVATAVLSTTARTKAREARKEARKAGTAASPRPPSGAAGGDGMEAPGLERVSSYLSTTSYLSVDEPKDKDKDKDGEAAKPKKEKEPAWFALPNPSRLVPAQVALVSLPTTATATATATASASAATVAAAADSASASASASSSTSSGPPRYSPIYPNRPPAGIVVLRDGSPGLPQAVTKVDCLGLGAGKGQEEEAPVLAAFEWDPATDILE